METNPPHTITINDLAGMVQRGFVESRKDMNERFDAVDQRFENMERRMDLRFDEAQGQLDNICTNYVTMREHEFLKSRVAKLENRLT